ncbi:MAG: SpoIIE family protein phosphatase [Planctomycetota bacterium]|nr:SpoIIE family protein phosphatase [Planctomycetota bacterium]
MTSVERSKPDSPIFLEPLDGPEIKTIALRDPSATFGRGAGCTVLLDHTAVSREHMALTWRAGTWYATDHASRNGTRLNGFALPAGEPTPLADADHLQLGPWTFRVRIGEQTHRSATMVTIQDDDSTAQRLRSAAVRESEPRVRQQFASLLKASALLYSAAGEQKLLECLLEASQSATGFERAAVLRCTDTFEAVEIVAQRARPTSRSKHSEDFQFSRSLLRAAVTGAYAVLAENSSTPRPDTLVRFDIAAAACAPIRLNEAIWGFLYLDSGSGPGTTPSGAGDLLEVTRTLADIASLALVRVKQLEVSQRLASLQSDVEAAAEIQRFLLPPQTACVEGVRYAMRSKPGRMVSGDVFDVMFLPGGKVGVLLGDVMGKGLGAGLVMSSVQSFLHAVLRDEADPASALQRLNDFLSPRLSAGRFVSLWLGIIDARAGTLTAADAGHGYALIVRPGADARPLQCAGGLPLAASDVCAYRSTQLPLTAGERLVLFSDGVVEQRSPAGEAFGLERLIDSLRPNQSPERDVEAIVSAVNEFAGPAAPSDDLTAASLCLV